MRHKCDNNILWPYINMTLLFFSFSHSMNKIVARTLKLFIDYVSNTRKKETMLWIKILVITNFKHFVIKFLNMISIDYVDKSFHCIMFYVICKMISILKLLYSKTVNPIIFRMQKDISRRMIYAFNSCREWQVSDIWFWMIYWKNLIFCQLTSKY